MERKQTIGAAFFRKAEVVYRAFTLVELLVVIAIIGILASFLMPALSKSLDLAKSAQCLSQLRQVYIAYFNYAELYDGKIPKGTSGYNPNDVHRGQSTMLDSGIQWGSHHPRVFVCPEAIKLDYWKNNQYSEGTYKAPSYYPSATFWTYTQKLADPISGSASGHRKPSESPMLGEVEESVVASGVGVYLWDFTPIRFGYYHLQGTSFNALYFDGHIQSISYAVMSTTHIWRGY